MAHRCHSTLSEKGIIHEISNHFRFYFRRPESGLWLTKECVWSQRPETIGAPNCIIWGGTLPDFQSCWIKLSLDGNFYHLPLLWSDKKVAILCLSTQSCSWISFPDSSIIIIPSSVSSMRRVEEPSRVVATVVVFIFCTQYFETSFDGDSPHNSRLYRYMFLNKSFKSATSMLVTDVGDEMCWRKF